MARLAVGGNEESPPIQNIRICIRHGRNRRPNARLPVRLYGVPCPESSSLQLTLRRKRLVFRSDPVLPDDCALSTGDFPEVHFKNLWEIGANNTRVLPPCHAVRESERMAGSTGAPAVLRHPAPNG